MDEAMQEEQFDEATGEILPDIPMRESLVPTSDAHALGVSEYKPTTLLDYSALMMAARAHPRDVKHALKTALAICTLDEETAKECFYALPRGGKKISGPSIGLAQTLAACYGNMNVTIDSIQILRDEGMVELRGFILDTESGLTTSDIIRRRITNKNGELYNDDMIATTTAAARSILWRNLVLRVIPRPLVRKIYNAALAVSMGGGKTFVERQKKCMAHWDTTYGIDKSKLLLHLGHTEVTDLTIQDFEYLLGIENAIRQGDTSIEAIFKKDLVPPPPGQKPKDLKEVAADLKVKNEQEAADDVLSKIGQAAVAQPIGSQPEPPEPPEPPAAPVSEPETAQVEMPEPTPPPPAPKPPGAPIKRPPGGPARK